MRTTLIVLALLATPFGVGAEDLYSVHSGDGIRAYTESRYDDALKHLYRAVAVRPTPVTLKLIVRSHDFQGNCTARGKAVELLAAHFPREPAPPVQRCARVGRLWNSGWAWVPT